MSATEKQLLSAQNVKTISLVNGVDNGPVESQIAKAPYYPNDREAVVPRSKSTTEQLSEDTSNGRMYTNRQ